MKHITYSLFILLCLVIYGCSKEDVSDTMNVPVRVKLLSSYDNAGSLLSETDSKINSLSGYICDGGKVVWFSHDLLESEKMIFPDTYRNAEKMYVIANRSLCPEVDKIQVGSTEQDLNDLLSSIGHDYVPSVLLMSSIVPISSIVSDNSVVHLQRNVARFDLQADEAVTVHSVSVSGIQARGSIFKMNTPYSGAETTTFNTTFAEGESSSRQCLFYSHEFTGDNQRQINVVLDVSYNGHRARTETHISAVQRNCIYRLRVKSLSGVISSDISCVDMEEGDDVIVKPQGEILRIDEEHSTLPDNCTLSENGQQLTFDYRGGQAMIAFTGSQKQELLKSVGSIKDFSITPQADGRFLINVGTNPLEIGSDVPATLLYFKAENESNSEKHQTLSIVAQRFAGFDFVQIGGICWMQVNALTESKQDYLITTDPTQAYREMYKKNWNQFGGKGNQWGPRPGKDGVNQRFAAWEVVMIYYYDLPNVNGAIIGGNNCLSWDGVCPEGWHLPTQQDFKNIWPTNNTVIPEGATVNYTTDTGHYTASIETLGNKCLVISDGTNEIIFPIAGYRAKHGINGGSFNFYGWNVGTETYYWCRDRVLGRNPFVFGINANTIKVQEFENNAWNQVRCVREIEK